MEHAENKKKTGQQNIKLVKILASFPAVNTCKRGNKFGCNEVSLIECNTLYIAVQMVPLVCTEWEFVANKSADQLTPTSQKRFKQSWRPVGVAFLPEWACTN